MNILGISAFCKDSSAVIISDNKVVAAASQERYSWLRHDSNFPGHAIDYCLRQAKIEKNMLDAVVYFEDPNSCIVRDLSSLFASFPSSRKSFTSVIKGWLTRKLWIKNSISDYLGLLPDKIHYTQHMQNHANLAYFESNFDNADILIVDGVGEWECTSTWSGKLTKDNSIEIKKISSINYPHSLGLVIEAFGRYLGFPKHEGAYHLAALSAFGSPRYQEKIKKIIMLKEDGSYSIDQNYFQFHDTESIHFTQTFLNEFGSPSSLDMPIAYDYLNGKDGECSSNPDDERFADIAASLQAVLEDTIVAIANEMNKNSSNENLCFTGDVAENPLIVKVLKDRTAYNNIYTPFDPCDNGAVLGAALGFNYYNNNTEKKVFSYKPYLGEQHDEGNDIKMLKYFNIGKGRNFASDGAYPAYDVNLDICKHEKFQDVLAETAENLKNGKIVGWYQGRFEFSQHTFGNRAILVDPSNVAAVSQMRNILKNKPSYLPFGLSITPEGFAEYLGNDLDELCGMRWGQMPLEVSGKVKEKFRGVVNSNNTILPHICHKEDNEKYYMLLQELQKNGGIPAVAYSSLNEQLFPVASDPSDALMVFVRTGIEIMVINHHIIKKERK
tara:strand:- start:23968 stop:25800 length:1833 start_codon:yes stop_codon:yes gene_type:complete